MFQKKYDAGKVYDAVVADYDYERNKAATSGTAGKRLGVHPATAREWLKHLEKKGRIWKFARKHSGAVPHVYLWLPAGKDLPEKYRVQGYARA